MLGFFFLFSVTPALRSTSGVHNQDPHQPQLPASLYRFTRPPVGHWTRLEAGPKVHLLLSRIFNQRLLCALFCYLGTQRGYVLPGKTLLGYLNIRTAPLTNRGRHAGRLLWSECIADDEFNERRPPRPDDITTFFILQPKYDST